MAILLMPLGQGLALLNNMDSVGMLLMPVRILIVSTLVCFQKPNN